MPGPPLPAAVADITAGWLERAFAAGGADFRVTAIAIDGHIAGASSKVRVRVESPSPGAPRKVVVKGGFEAHSREMRGMHWAEARAYRDFLPRAPASAPRCWFAGVDDEGQGLVVLEDLDDRGVRFLSLRQPIDFDTARRFLDRLAQLHAAMWGSPELEDGALFGDIAMPMVGRFETYIDRLTEPATFAAYCERPRGAAVPVALHDAGRLRAGLWALRDSYAGQARTLVHGDTHLGNLYLNADGSPGFLDWVIRRAPWQNEVAYFLGAALDLPDRRRWEGALLEHYLGALAGLGIAAPGFDRAWLLYRRDLVWGFFIWFLNHWDFQTEPRNTAAATRFAMAMLDHDVYGLLGA